MQCANYFYPRPPRGGRRTIVLPSSRSTYFYPRPPRGGRRFGGDFEPRTGRFLSTPSARRATKAVRRGHYRSGISIHALREEGDTKTKSTEHKSAISIHALREEGDFVILNMVYTSVLFLSTPSARRATPDRRHHGQAGEISIHALREEGDVTVVALVSVFIDFYPRPPRGGRLGARR